MKKQKKDWFDLLFLILLGATICWAVLQSTGVAYAN